MRVLRREMHVTRRISGESGRVNILLQNTIFRYLLGIAAVASVFAVRTWLVPLTGVGAPFVLFYAAVLATSVLAGVGPGVCAALLSMPVGAHIFAVRAGYPVSCRLSSTAGCCRASRRLFRDIRMPRHFPAAPRESMPDKTAGQSSLFPKG